MSKTIDFKTTPTGNDTGEADEDAITPLANGETGSQGVLNRPLEVLRDRTEALRAEINENLWVRDADRGAVHMSLTTGTLTWGGAFGGGTGKLVLSAGASLVLESAVNPGAARGFANEGGGLRYPTRYYTAAVDDGNGDNVVFQALKRDFEGAFNITVTVVDDPGSGTIAVSVNGLATVSNPALQPGRDDIVVTYDSTVPHKWDAVVTAILAHPVASLLVDVTYTPGGPAQDVFDVATFALEDGFDYVHHEITDTVLGTFFLTAENCLRVGDTLAIWYDTPQLRRESVEENVNKHLIPASSLVNLTLEPAKAANCVPIARVGYDGHVVLANGFRMSDGVAVAHVQSGMASFVPVDTSPFVNIAPATDDVQAALEALDTAVGTSTTSGDKAIATLRTLFWGLVAAGGRVFASGATTVDVIAGRFFQTGNAAYADVTIGAAAGLATAGPNENYVVFANLAGVPAYQVETEATYLASSGTGRVPLAYVVVTGGAIAEIVDVRNIMRYIDMQGFPYTVGEMGRYETLKGALKAIELYDDAIMATGGTSPNAARAEILIIDDITIEASVITGSTNIKVPSNTTIRALPGKTITVSNLGAEVLFDLQASENVTFRDLTFAFSGTTSVNSILFADNTGAPTNVRFENVTCLEGASAAQTVGKFLYLFGGFLGTLTLRDCAIQTQLIDIDIDAGGAGEAGTTLLVENCRFAGGTAGNGDGQPMTVARYNNHTDPAFKNDVVITGCSFGEANAGSTSNYSVIDAPRMCISDCVFHGLLALEGVASLAEVHVTNCMFDFRDDFANWPTYRGVACAMMLHRCTNSTVVGCTWNVHHTVVSSAVVLDLRATGYTQVSACTFVHRTGAAIRTTVDTTNSTDNVISNIRARCVVNDPTGYAVWVDTGSDRTLVTGIHAANYDDDQAVRLDGDYCLVSNLLVEQTTLVPFGTNDGGGEYDGVDNNQANNKIALETILLV